jgi:hypothetical protein
MDVLPWLLDWPPSPAKIVAFLLLTAASVGTLVAFGGVTDRIADENVTVADADLTVRLNDETNIPDTNGTVQTCLGSGTPGDSVAVLGDVTVDAPAAGTENHSTDRPLTVVVGLPETGETTTQTVEGSGGTADVFWTFEDEEVLSAGETTTLRVRVRSGETTVATATQSVTIENDTRSYDC